MITAYWMGVTANFGAHRGYIDTQGDVYAKLKGPVGYWARIMYSAATFWLCAAFFTAVASLCGFGYALGRIVSGRGSFDRIYTGMAWLLGSSLLTTWLATWLFWAGFVKVAGDL